MTELTTTSFAILGLLSVRPHTAYELAAQSQRSFRFLWPTAPSRLYAEPKRLARLGLIEVEAEAAGPTRTRQRFHITPAGRDELRRWLSTPPAPPRLEHEVLLRTFLADAGSIEDLTATLEVALAQAEQAYLTGRALLAGYAVGENPFPERLHLNLVWIAFLYEYFGLLTDWAAFAAEEVASWPSTREVGETPRALELLDSMLGGRQVVPRRPPPSPAS